MYNKYVPYFTLVISLLVSICAAFYSVCGLAKLFSGAYTQVIIMASSLEIAKILIASVLYRKWTDFKLLIKLYLTSALLILIVITSGGIYGYLSNAYQITKTADQQTTKQIELIEFKKVFFVDKKKELDTEKSGIILSIEQLRNDLGQNFQQTIDKKTGQIIRTTSNETRKSYEHQLDEAIKRRDIIAEKSNSLNDSIVQADLKIIDIQNNSSASSELGPLRFISTLTGKSMDVIVNWFLLLLIIVFDPLAIILMITSSVLFLANYKKDNLIVKDKITDNINESLHKPELSDTDFDFLKYTPAAKSKTESVVDSEKLTLTSEQIKNMSHQDVEKYFKENLDK